MRGRGSGGFTLLEVLIAFAVTVTVLVPVAVLIVQAGATRMENERYLTALFLAQAKLEEFRSEPSEARISEGTFSEPYQDYHFCVTTAYLGYGVCAVNVSVSFAVGGKDKIVGLRSALRDDP